MGISLFGQRLKTARIGAGFTQTELASRVGAYQSKYKNWEAGINEPDIETINKLADVLGVTTDWLLGRDVAEKPYPKEFEKEIHLLREEAKQYGPDSVKRLRKMLPLLYVKPYSPEEKKLIAAAEKKAAERTPQVQAILKQHSKKGRTDK